MWPNTAEAEHLCIQVCTILYTLLLVLLLTEFSTLYYAFEAM